MKKNVVWINAKILFSLEKRKEMWYNKEKFKQVKCTKKTAINLGMFGKKLCDEVFMKRPVEIELLGIEEGLKFVYINYRATYANGKKKVHRKMLNELHYSFVYTSFLYYSKPRIKKVVLLDTISMGGFKRKRVYLFLVDLTDGTKDIIQENEGTKRCNTMLAKNLDSCVR